MFNLVLASDKSLDALSAFYNEALPKAGYTIAGSASAQQMRVMQFKRGEDASGQVQIHAQAEKRSVILIVRAPK